MVGSCHPFDRKGADTLEYCSDADTLLEYKLGKGRYANDEAEKWPPVEIDPFRESGGLNGWFEFG